MYFYTILVIHFLLSGSQSICCWAHPRPVHPLLDAFLSSCVGLFDLGAPLRCVGVRLPHYCWAAAALRCPRRAEIEVKGKVSLVIFLHIRIGEGEGFSHASLSGPLFVPQSRIHVFLAMKWSCDEQKLKHIQKVFMGNSDK